MNATMRPLRILALFALPLLAGCQQKMGTEGRLRPDAASEFFSDGASARPQVPGTVARGEPPIDLAKLPAKVPLKLTPELLKRGRTRYEITCVPCHGFTGEGDGTIVQRGFTAPPNLHLDRLRKSPDSHFFRVMSEGYGAMYSYANRLTPEDRWAVTAYIRALQMSQGVDARSLPASDRKKLEQLEGGGK